MYRVDKRPFKIGDTINAPETSYQDSEKFDKDKQTLEKILTEEKPNDKNADRRTGLYVFAELSDAMRFCCIMSDSRIYKVAALTDTICFHRGDMNWTEIMQRFIASETTLRQLAGFYWAGTKTFKPCWEMLFNRVKVTRVIIGDNETRNNLCKNYNTAAGNVERIDFYLEQLTER